jgi:polyisoprenoid-binding protein YceI
VSRFSRLLPILCLVLLTPSASNAVTLNNHSSASPVISVPEAPPIAAPTPSASAGGVAKSVSASVPSGIYQLDPTHANVTFKINHLGFSRYTGRFDKMEAVLSLNAASPADSSLEVTVEPNSIDINNAKLEEDLRGDKWFNVITFPRASFVSKDIVLTGPTTAKVTGDFTLLGETHPLTLDVTLVGQGENTFLGKPVIGFSAVGTFRRSDYGLSNLLPMVGDDVALEIEAEFDKAE